MFAILLEDVGLVHAVAQPILLVGTDSTNAFGQPLPWDLEPLGAGGYWLLVNPTWVLNPSPPSGLHYAEVTFGVPDDPSLAGITLYGQWVIHDPEGNSAGIALSKGAVINIVP
jgi:hypothetical protein